MAFSDSLLMLAEMVALSFNQCFELGAATVPDSGGHRMVGPEERDVKQPCSLLFRHEAPKTMLR